MVLFTVVLFPEADDILLDATQAKLYHLEDTCKIIIREQKNA
jgi:hypothetical protein